MEQWLKARLPEAVRLLLDEIEAVTHVEIAFKHVPDLWPPEAGMSTTISFGNPDSEPWSVHVGEPSSDAIHVTVNYRDDIGSSYPYYPKPYGCLAHELLHVHRYLVEKVPILYCIQGIPQSGRESQDRLFTAPGFGMLFSVQGMEQTLEHLVIERQVPNYISGYPPLSLCLREVWDSVPKKPWKYEFLQRWLVLQEWVKAVFVSSDVAVLKRALEVMEQVDLARDGWRFAAQLHLLLASPDPVAAKQAMALAACQAFRIPPAAMMLLYDGKLGKPIPHSIVVPTVEGELVHFGWQWPPRRELTISESSTPVQMALPGTPGTHETSRWAATATWPAVTS